MTSHAHPWSRFWALRVPSGCSVSFVKSPHGGLVGRLSSDEAVLGASPAASWSGDATIVLCASLCVDMSAGSDAMFALKNNKKKCTCLSLCLLIT